MTKQRKMAARKSRLLTDDDLRAASGAAVNAYLQLDGVKGESVEDRHKDWIEVLSYSHR